MSAEEIRQIRDNTFDPSPYYPDGGGEEPPVENWPLKDQAYTIKNFSGTPAYMVDNVEGDNRITCEGSTGDAAYWVFEPTANAQCYFVRNLLTGRYIQGYAKTAEQMVGMGSEGVEYYVAAQTSEGGRYGFACTSVTPHDFSAGTIGLNLRAESNQANCYVQTYAAAAGTNHRSFWTLDVVPDDVVTSIKAFPVTETEKTDIKPLSNKSFDLQGRPSSKHAKGIRVQQGRKYLQGGE